MSEFTVFCQSLLLKEIDHDITLVNRPVETVNHEKSHLFSIGMTILNKTLSKHPTDTIGFRVFPNMPKKMDDVYMCNVAILQYHLGNGVHPKYEDVVTKNASLYAEDIEHFKSEYGQEALDMVASLMRWNPEERIGLAHKYFKGSVKKLYHQTNPQAAEAIIASQVFFPGKVGILGGGIYFAASVSDTDRKAESKGVILVADVSLGRIATFTAHYPKLTLQELKKQGYDSSYIMMNSGPEYVVYDTSQVKNIRYASGPDILNRELTLVYPGFAAAKVLMLIVGNYKGHRVAYLGRDAKTQQYRLFGGTHDKQRTRGDNARNEWCEEFGAFLKSASIVCDPPTVEYLKKCPKIFQGNRIAKGGPPKTNILMLLDMKKRRVSPDQWNKNNQMARANTTTPADYKEIDALYAIRLDVLIQLATKPSTTQHGVSDQVLSAVRDFKKAKIL